MGKAASPSDRDLEAQYSIRMTRPQARRYSVKNQKNARFVRFSGSDQAGVAFK